MRTGPFRVGLGAMVTAALLTGAVPAGAATTVTFGPATNFAAGDGSASLTSADFDGDGNLDLGLANQFSNNVSVLLGNGKGSFKKAETFDAGDGSAGTATADFNGDGKPDLATANENSNNVSVLLNTTRHRR